MLLRFFYPYPHCRPTKDLLHRILVAFCSLIPTFPKIGCGFMGESLLRLVKEIHMAAEKFDISDLIATILDVRLMPCSIPSASASAILPSISCTRDWFETDDAVHITEILKGIAHNLIRSAPVIRRRNMVITPKIPR
jgi:hypothetical protein